MFPIQLIDRRSPIRALALSHALMVGFLLTSTGPLAAQAGDGAAPLPAGNATVIFEGRQVAAAPYLIHTDGPLLALPAMARVLGLELLVGPLGDSHRLAFKEKEVLIGPDPAAVVRFSNGAQEILQLRQLPVKSPAGLHVPLDFLARVAGEELGLDLAWDEVSRELVIERREVREIGVEIDVIHQHSSTVEIRFAAPPTKASPLSQAPPRYRFEEAQNAFVIRLRDDRFALPVDVTSATSPLVHHVVVTADRLRFELAENAGVATPRVIEDPDGGRLVVEVYQRAAARSRQGETVAEGSRQSVRTIVIDPGHGGLATGAIGPGGTAEKDLALTVARQLENLLERRMAVRVVLTRDSDHDLPHETRTAIANQNRADLFVSIHFNSSYGRTAHGAETYFLSREASDQIAAEVAAAENEESGESNPESDLQLILWDLAQSYHLAESQRFANLVQEELNLALGLRDRGVKQAPFRVLMGATMPSVLVELGFLSNPEEEVKLTSPVYQAELVDALYRAIRRFKTQLEAQSLSSSAELQTGRQP